MGEVIEAINPQGYAQALKVDSSGHLITSGTTGGGGGNATEANQNTMLSNQATMVSSLTSIDSKVSNISDGSVNIKGNFSGTQNLLTGTAVGTNQALDVNVVQTSATSGDATASNQTTMITSLGTINTSVGTTNTALTTSNTNTGTIATNQTNGNQSTKIFGNNSGSQVQLKVDANGVLETSGGGGGGGDASATNQTTMITSLGTINTSVGATNTALTTSNTNTGTIATNQTNGNQSTKIFGNNGGTQVQLKVDANGVLETSGGGGGGGGDASATNQTTMIGNQTNGTQATKIFGSNGGTQVQLKCDSTGILETTGGGTTGDIHAEIGGTSTALTGTTIGSDNCLDVNIIAGGSSSTSANQATMITNQTNGTQQTKMFGNNGGSQVQVKCDANGVISVSGGGEGGGDATATNQTTMITSLGTINTTLGAGNTNTTSTNSKLDTLSQAIVDGSQSSLLIATHGSTATQHEITCSQSGGTGTKQFLDVGAGARFQSTAEVPLGSTDNGYYSLKCDSLKNLLTNPQGIYNSSGVSLSDGDQVSLQLDTIGNLMVSSLNTANVSGTLQAISGTSVGSAMALDVNVVQTTGGGGGATGETTTQNITIAGTYPLEIAGDGGSTSVLDLGAGANVSEFQFTIAITLTNSASTDQKLLLQKIVPVSYHDGHGVSETFNLPCDYSVIWTNGFNAGSQIIFGTFTIKRPLRYIRLVNNNYKNPNRVSPTTYYDFRISFIKASKVVMT